MRIVMDDAGGVPQELVDESETIVVPVNIASGPGEYLSRISINQATFFEKIKRRGSENFPKTSRPTPYQFDEVYRKLFSEEESEILTITVGETLSGTYAPAEAFLEINDGVAAEYKANHES